MSFMASCLLNCENRVSSPQGSVYPELSASFISIILWGSFLPILVCRVMSPACRFPVLFLSLLLILDTPWTSYMLLLYRTFSCQLNLQYWAATLIWAAGNEPKQAGPWSVLRTSRTMNLVMMVVVLMVLALFGGSSGLFSLVALLRSVFRHYSDQIRSINRKFEIKFPNKFPDQPAQTRKIKRSALVQDEEKDCHGV